MPLTWKAPAIEKLASKHQVINWDFRSMLKMTDISDRAIDKVVRRHYADVSSQIVCTTCGNCCLQMTPVLSKQDIERLSKHLKVKPDELRKRYLKYNRRFKAYEFRESPCPFLEGKICSVYKGRPHDCRSYPHLHKTSFRNRATYAFSNCSTCPIIYHVFTRTRQELMHQLDPAKFTWK